MLVFWFVFLVVLLVAVNLLVYLKRAEKVIRSHDKHCVHPRRGQKTTWVWEFPNNLNIATSTVVNELTTMSLGVFVWLWYFIWGNEMCLYITFCRHHTSLKQLPEWGQLTHLRRSVDKLSTQQAGYNCCYFVFFVTFLLPGCLSVIEKYAEKKWRGFTLLHTLSWQPGGYNIQKMTKLHFF